MGKLLGESAAYIRSLYSVFVLHSYYWYAVNKCQMIVAKNCRITDLLYNLNHISKGERDNATSPMLKCCYREHYYSFLTTFTNPRVEHLPHYIQYAFSYIQGVSKVRSDCKLYFAQSIYINASLGKCKLIQVRNLSK